MNLINKTPTSNMNTFNGSEAKTRRASQGNEPEIFTDIYREDTNIAIWQRELTETLKQSVDAFLQSNAAFQASMTVTPQSALSSISEALGNKVSLELSKNISELVDMFCCLFELQRVGLRLTVLDRAMCPRFHVDKVNCRLVTTFQGVATEWLSQQSADRSKLGMGSNGQPDNQSGLYKSPQDIQQLNCGEVALLKGELWEGNENAGLIHRSPSPPEGERRLLLTLDFSY
ncbi:DUF1826 domain-containing protein [Marinomonas sp. 2405UD68-3]|uniref:DUF1826 domain-containing protein n=1 Tax=Marinomonas sp. 2405UD68-3 TaxID=3391835 RepID=UPI0039C8D2ED